MATDLIHLSGVLKRPLVDAKTADKLGRVRDLVARIDTAEARRKELLALMTRSGSGVGGGAVNMFVYQPDVDRTEAELRALQQTVAEKSCPANVTKAPAKPEPGMGPIH